MESRTALKGCTHDNDLPTPSHQTTVNTRIGELKYENEYPSEETVRKLYDEISKNRSTTASSMNA